MFKPGDQVKVKFTGTLQGEVIRAAVDDDSNFQFLVAFTDNFGESQERFFLMDDLEAA
jgi:hypothetical protein